MVSVQNENLTDKPAGAYGEHQLQIISRLYSWTIGLNGTGLLICFAFIVSEYQVVYNDCLSQHIASNSISFMFYISLIFLTGALISRSGIVIHTALLGKYIYARQKKVEAGTIPFIRQSDQISVSECRSLVNYQAYIWAFSLAFFVIGLIISYIAIYSINYTSVDNTVKVFSKECPPKVSGSAAPAMQNP